MILNSLDLPYSLEVGGIQREIYCDFRDVINIFIALNDKDLSEKEKRFIMLNNLYVDDFLTFENINEAVEKAVWFLDWGQDYSKKENSPKVLDWEHDYNMIISAVSKNIKTAEDARELSFLHWWTFLSYFSERGESMISVVLEIREKLIKGKKLEQYEKDILRDNNDLIVLNNKDEDEDVLWE